LNSSPSRRVLLKLSGEVLAGPRGVGFDPEVIERLASELKSVREAGIELAVVIGGGNIFRGVEGTRIGIERTTGDHMGMVATVLNAVTLREALTRQGSAASVWSSFALAPLAERFSRAAALARIHAGEIVLLAGGTGAPFFTTDSGAALRACELGVDSLIKGTKVRGVYSADPETDPDARFYPSLSFARAVAEQLRVMDITALTLCQDNDVPVQVFSVLEHGNILRAALGEHIGTIVSKGDEP
jgi:uridylate kinase